MSIEYVVKVYPKKMSRDVFRTLVISEEATLDDLCALILKSYKFDNEHLYEFCMDNRKYSTTAYRSHHLRYEASTETKIKELGLVKRQKFLFHYDFGDDWMFVVYVQRISEAPLEKRPTILRAKGELIQYPDKDGEEREKINII